MKPRVSTFYYLLTRPAPLNSTVLRVEDSPEKIGVAWRGMTSRPIIRKSRSHYKEGETASKYNFFELDPSEALRTGIHIDEWCSLE